MGRFPRERADREVRQKLRQAGHQYGFTDASIPADALHRAVGIVPKYGVEDGPLLGTQGRNHLPVD
jgi:hypothetical protein